MKTQLILDLETDSFNRDEAHIKVYGLYNIHTQKYTITTSKDEALREINKADFIITFNGKEYDLPILHNHGIDIPAYKHIDLYFIFKKRESVITKKPFSNFKLRTIVDELHLDDEGGKGEVDYSLFRKSEHQWTQEERDQIWKYTKQDLLITAKCWEFLKDKFDPFKEFLSKQDIDNFKYVNSSMGAYSYKVICNMTGIKEEYDFSADWQPYQGAYVQKPKKEYVRGKIICFDFASLYPSMYIMANLFSHHCDCCHPEERWHGNDFFKVTGSYCQKKLGSIESLIKNFYGLRQKFKKDKDQREQVMKIVLNSIYGISGSPIFKNLYNINTASDCTSLGRQCIKYAIGEFERNGFVGLYSDTDSVYVEVPDGKSENEALQLAKTIAKNLSNHFPFPWDGFDFKFETNIKYIVFFKDDNELGSYKKKHYLYVTDDDKLTIKGIVLVKKDCSSLSKKLFNQKIRQNIIDKLQCKYDRKEIIMWINNELLSNPQIAAKQFSIKNSEDYANETSIQYLIWKQYGSGTHLMIKNFRRGVGKAVKYCTLDEAKDLNISDFDIGIFLKELSPFIKQDQQNTLEIYK